MFNVHGERVALVTDTSCDLSDEQLARYDISMVSLRVVAAAGEFRDRVEINQEEMYELLKNEVPKTSLPLPVSMTSGAFCSTAQRCHRKTSTRSISPSDS